jgi:hypothetical protein
MNARALLTRFLTLVGLLLTAPAGMIVFIVIPYAVFERWHLLPDWDILKIIYLLVPIALAWNHAGV